MKFTECLNETKQSTEIPSSLHIYNYQQLSNPRYSMKEHV